MAPNYDSYEVKITTNTGNTWTTLGSVTSGIDFAMDTDKFDKYVLGKWDTNEEERNNTMNILELYERRLKEEITERYNRMIKEEYENLNVVKEYNELTNTFKINMKQLAEKYNTNDDICLIPTCYTDDYSYELSDSLWYTIEEKYNEQKAVEIRTINELCEEVRVVLSLSDDKDYQLEVLRNYEIIDKKGKLNI